jgi:single-stranded DNA-binding protein
MNIQGKIVEIFDAQQVSDRFRKREFVIEYVENPQYPEFVKFELTQDRCAVIDDFAKGDLVDVHFNIRGRAWTNQQGVTNYFNSLQAWRVLPAGQEKPAGGSPAPMAEPVSSSKGIALDTNADDDLPF